MIEYGGAAGEQTGRLGASGSGASGDLWATTVDTITDAMDSVSSMPPEQLLVIGVAIVAGLVVVKRLL